MPTLPSPSSVAAAALVLLLAAPASASAQRVGNAALPFHAGQWGLTANVGQSFGLGLVRFTAPGHALVIDGSFGVQRSTQTIPLSPYDPNSPRTERWLNGYVGLDVGQRRFHPLGERVALFHTLGVHGSYQKSNTLHFWGAGVFGDLGAQYMFDPRFGLGVAAGLRAGYSEQRYRTSGALTRSGTTGIGTDPARVIAAVYF